MNENQYSVPHAGSHGKNGLDKLNPNENPYPLLSALDATPADPVRGDIISAQGATPLWTRLAKSVPGGAGLMNVLGFVQGDTEPAWKAAEHSLLSVRHSDSVVQTVSRGSLIYGNSTPAWDELVQPASPAVLYSDATDVAWDTMAWIAVAYNSGDFTAGSGTWTVDSGDVTTLAYRLIGKTMVVAFWIVGTDVSATPLALRIAIPASKTAARTVGTACFISDAGTGQAGLAFVSASGTTIAIQKASGAAFTLTAGDNTNVIGEITFETT